MKAISLWQPWASLWVRGVKIHETRSWGSTHRGWTLVHAAKHKITVSALAPDLVALCEDEFGGHWVQDFPYGAIIGAVYIDECYEIKDDPERPFTGMPYSPEDLVAGDWTFGRFAWRASNRVEFSKPIAYRGAQRFFDVPWDRVLRDTEAGADLLQKARVL